MIDNNTGRFILGVMVIALFTVYALVISLLPVHLDPQVQGVILGILGSGGFTVVVSFFFGSSQGSVDKSAQIKEMTVGGKP